MILKTAVDAYANQSAPATNYGPRVRLYLNGGTSGNDKQAFIWFPRQVPPEAVVLMATLRVYTSGAWSGTNDLTAKRINTAWRESTLRWNNRPSVVATNAATETLTGTADKALAEFDVTDIMQDVADGEPFWGFRIELTQNVDRALRSAEDPNEALRPVLELEYTVAPEAPDRLAPDGGDAVSVSHPLLDWRFTDSLGTGPGSLQAYAQVQITSDPAEFATTPDFDSGKVANTESSYDTSSGAFGGISDGATLYWRAKVWDGTDVESEWSEPAEFRRDDLGTLSLSSPGATVGETTPPVSWSLTGETQAKYRVTLFEVGTGGALIQLWQTAAAGTDNSINIEHGHLVAGKTFRVRVEVWDTEARVGDEHRTAEQDFTYVRDGTPTAVSTLTVTTTPDSPGVTLTWTRAAQPDFFALVVDGVLVEDRIEPADAFVSGTTYTWQYWGVVPRVVHTFEVEAVVQASPGTPYQHSDGNPVRTATTAPSGHWLVDEADSTAVRIVGIEDPTLDIGENGTTYVVLSSPRKVRILDSVRGYEGAISGQLLGPAQRDAFLELKRRNKQLRLIIGDLSFPVRLEAVTAKPTRLPGDDVYAVAFAFFQDGEPWPVTG